MRISSAQAGRIAVGGKPRPVHIEGRVDPVEHKDLPVRVEVQDIFVPAQVSRALKGVGATIVNKGEVEGGLLPGNGGFQARDVRAIGRREVGLVVICSRATQSATAVEGLVGLGDGRALTTDAREDLGRRLAAEALA